MKTYDSSDLKDERWLRKRDKILSYADHRCQTCGVENTPLQVHHSYYRDGLRAWEYPDGSLVALCEDCHGRVIHKVLPNRSCHWCGRDIVKDEKVLHLPDGGSELYATCLPCAKLQGFAQ